MGINKIAEFIQCPDCRLPTLFTKENKLCCSNCANSCGMLEGVPVASFAETQFPNLT
jgi:hypothetical protein